MHVFFYVDTSTKYQIMNTAIKPISEVLIENEDAFIPIIDSKKFSYVCNKMRTFFLSKGFQEVHTQNRLSIMAACEDPSTIATYEYAGKKWPLPQTGQMWLEHELLSNPTSQGYFCVSTSFRNEVNPVPGRHSRIFPMFEFELAGDMESLIQLQEELLDFIGFERTNKTFAKGDYEDLATQYNTSIIEQEHEALIGEDYGAVFFLKNFPERTSPFWNMKRDQENPSISKKVDVLLHGMETIGSAERSCDAEQQLSSFLSIEDGEYAKRLYDLFGKERVLDELRDYLSHRFIPRSGGGIGITRMIRAMELSNLL